MDGEQSGRTIFFKLLNITVSHYLGQITFGVFWT